MSTLAEIEQAIETLPPEDREELVSFLAARRPPPPPAARRERAFPVSRGRMAFGSEQVARIEAEAR